MLTGGLRETPPLSGGVALAVRGLAMTEELYSSILLRTPGIAMRAGEVRGASPYRGEMLRNPPISRIQWY